MNCFKNSKKNTDKPKVDFIKLSKTIDINYVEANINKPWSWVYLSSNPNITWEFVEANQDKLWDWYGLTRNQNITLDIIEANQDKPWDWDWLCYFIKD